MAKDNDDSGSSSTQISKLDFGDPLYLHPSDISSTLLITVKLKGTENYKSWSCAMELALQTKNKMGFINGTLKRSEDNEKELKETYDKIDGSVIFNLYQKLNSITQGGSSVSDYYHNLNSLWKQYDTMVQLPSCDLTSSKAFKDHTSLIKLMQFLMRLDDIYQPIKSNILTRDPLPSVNTAFSIISREESHRKSNMSGKKNTESSAFYTNTFKPNSNQQFKELKCTKFGKTNHTIDKCFEVIGYPTRSGNLKCTKCGMTNHTIDKCFEVVGYPNYLRKKGFGSNNNFKGNASKANNDIPRSSSSTPISLSNEQIMRLLSLLDDNGGVKPGVSNMAGNFENYNVFFNSQFDIFYKNNMISDNVESIHYGWIIDFGANQHMTNSINNFVSHTDVSDLNLTVSHPNGTKAKVSKIGNLKISNDIILKDVLVVLDYCVSLLSVHCLVRDNNLFVGFDDVACYIQDLVSKKTIVTGSQCGGLYFLTGNEKGIVGSSNITKVDKYSVDLWHCRLGHPAEQALMCDNGTEFVNSKVNDFVLSNGIVHQTSCAYTPQQNGLVERKHRHLLNVARAIMFQGGIPLRFWDECILTAVYLINKTPTSLLNGKCPFEIIYNRVPNLSHLRVFGCLAFSTILNNSDKFAERDVKFYETIFPFKIKKEDMQFEKCLSPINFFKEINKDNQNTQSPNDEGEDNEHQIEGSSDSMPVDDTYDSSSSDELDVNARSPSPTATLSDDNTNPEGNVLQNQEAPTYSFQPRRSQRNTSIPKKYTDFVLNSNVKYN
ncbi:uncharacterized protein [Rutidosis leptorrhynchoides]|uniref:uncharacterized protein n=1 Tax=Rutidosis leptorrhynchoides TaxID=125765 RepID=UPI003A99E107